MSGQHLHMDNLNMKIMAWRMAITLTVLAVCPFTVSSQCDKINDCRCKLPDGKVIDISSLGNKGGSKPKYDYALPDDGQSLFYEYSFNGCYAYSDKYCTGSVSCQKGKNDDTGPGFPLGTPDTADYTDGTTLRFSATGQDGQLRTTEVALVCDESGTSASTKLERLGEAQNNWIFYYRLTSKCVCGNGCAAGGGGDGGISIGSILCIIFSVVAVVYFVAGVIFMKFVRGAEGKEVIPNVTLWTDFPLLVKDGTLYVVSFFTSISGSSNSSYDDI